MRAMTAILFASLSLPYPTAARAAETDWKKIDLVFGRTAAVTGPVHRYGLPRSDLKVSLDGVQLNAGFTLGGLRAQIVRAHRRRDHDDAAISS